MEEERVRVLARVDELKTRVTELEQQLQESRHEVKPMGDGGNQHWECLVRYQTGSTSMSLPVFSEVLGSQQQPCQLSYVASYSLTKHILGCLGEVIEEQIFQTICIFLLLWR